MAWLIIAFRINCDLDALTDARQIEENRKSLKLTAVSSNPPVLGKQQSIRQIRHHFVCDIEPATIEILQKFQAGTANWPT